MNRERGAVFCQSLSDFPCTVQLGEKLPTWGISRWGGNKGLQFIPSDDEGFVLRGDKRRLVYKGRRQSHRFTVLGDCAFEYDCVLEREPESNVIVLRIEGAENFDFFRQPDFVREPFLKGSYAVYKKDTMIGEGTGKLCHIHRPEIIDAMGRRCWGELAVVGSELRITIPEDWLGGAKYPVVVDPTVGTTLVGNQTQTAFTYQNGYQDNGLHDALCVNRYYVPQEINGTVTAYVYAYNKSYSNQCKPVFYSDNNNVPSTKRSSNENNFNVAIASGQQGEWRSTALDINTDTQSGSYIWFGLSAILFYFRFDYGLKCYWYGFNNNSVNMPYSFPKFPDGRYYDYKMSLYFTYNAAQNHVLKLTQGVTLTDAMGFTADYKRAAAQTSEIADNRNLTAEYKRSLFQDVNGFTPIYALFSYFRKCVTTVSTNDVLSSIQGFMRSIFNQTGFIDALLKSKGFKLKMEDTLTAVDDTKKSKGFFSWIRDGLDVFEKFDFPVLFVRVINETKKMMDAIRQVREYIRHLFIEAGSIAEIKHNGNFYRKENDMIQAEGSVFRHLFIFIKIFTVSAVRDFVIRRFLVAKEELVIKSCITREIKLESKII